ncbi:MAG: pyridoxal phosphate-dependent aminotransferase family protein [Planctomycetota bacterium]
MGTPPRATAKSATDRLHDECSLFLDHMEQGFGIRAEQSSSCPEAGGKYVTIDGVPNLDFTRLDYLGLGSDPVVKQHMRDAVAEYDVSCTAAQVVFKPGVIRELEEKIAQWHGLNHSLIFTSGFAANANVIQALGQRMTTPHMLAYTRAGRILPKADRVPTIFFADRRCHYSILTPIRLCRKSDPERCEAVQFEDLEQLEAALAQSWDVHGGDALRVICSDTLESSSGKIYDIAALYALAERYDALLYLDEAHAVGTIGKTGAGVAVAQLPADCDMRRVLIMGTLTKAVGQLGGYVACHDERVASALRIWSLQYVGSAPIPTWMAAALLKIVDHIQGPEGARRRTALRQLTQSLCVGLHAHGFSVVCEDSHIVSIRMGAESRCLAIKERLTLLGHHVAAFVYPSTPKGGSMLRVSICSDLTEADLADLVAALAAAAADVDANSPAPLPVACGHEAPAAGSF